MMSRLDAARKSAVSLFGEILELAFPSDIYCICCGKPITPDRLYSICDDCIRTVHWANGRTCAKCGKILQDWHRSELCLDCARIRHEFLRGFSCVQYNEIERRLVHGLKYEKKRYLARKIAAIMADRLMAEDAAPDMIVPVPMFKAKERKRGYNQAALIAGALSGLTGIRLSKNVLCRIRDTEPMNSLSPGERRRNMESAFAVPSKHAPSIRGRAVLLVDDVYTTGSTADACAAALRDSGASIVLVLAFAAGPNEVYK